MFNVWTLRGSQMHNHKVSVDIVYQAHEFYVQNLNCVVKLCLQLRLENNAWCGKMLQNKFQMKVIFHFWPIEIFSTYWVVLLLSVFYHFLEKTNLVHVIISFLYYLPFLSC